MPDRPTDGLKVGDRVPLPPKPKLRVVPLYKQGEAPKSLRGAFKNGSRG